MIVEVLLKGILLIIKPLFTLIKTLIPSIRSTNKFYKCIRYNINYNKPSEQLYVFYNAETHVIYCIHYC